jgi:hypothetical protein
MLRDLLSSRRGGGKGDHAKSSRTRSDVRRGGNGSEMRIELASTDREEPTWEVRRPGDTRRRRLNGRTGSILAAAAAAAIVVNVGAAWVYWRIDEAESGRVDGGLPVELALRARNDLNESLEPGGTGGLTVTVTNDYGFPIQVTTVRAGAGHIVADDEHRDAGCLDPAVDLTQDRFSVQWDVPRNTVGAFTVPGALAMRVKANKACLGAVFTVPVTVSGTSRADF